MDLDPQTGGAVEGWPHVLQSLETILATKFGTRVFRREFGSDLTEFIDAPSNDATRLKLFVAVSEAIAEFEPRFSLSEIAVDEVTEGGVVVLSLTGTYLPRAHLGDFSTAEDGTRRVRVQSARVDSWSET